MKKSIKRILGATCALALLAGAGVALGSVSKDAVKVSAATAEFTLSSASDVEVDGVSVSFGKGSGSSAPAWYAAGLRLYASNTVTITSSNTITGVTFNWEKQGSKAFNTVTADVGTYNHPSAAGEGVWSGSETTIVFTLGSSGQLQLNTFSVNYDGGSTAELESLTVSGSMTKSAYTTAESWDPTGLTVSGHYDDGTDKDVTSKVSWSYDPASPADGVTSVVATASLSGKSASSTAQAVTVTVAHAGTAEDPFTVAEALAKAAEIGAVGSTGQGPWVTKGIISRVTSAPAATYWNATYYISDDGSQTNELQVYRGYYIDNVKFDAETAALLTAGKIAIVTGKLTGSYGSEYCQGNYLLSLESPSTGDIDVTFEPETSFEIGDAGSFSASTTATSPTYTWSVEDSSVMSVNASTGAFEALALGTTKVTVSVSATEGDGEASAYVTVNGNSVISIADANAIAESLESGATTPYYVYVNGYISQFDSDGQARALTIRSLDETDSIMVFVGKSGYSSFISGLSLGDSLTVRANVQNFSGTYELQSPAKVASSYSAVTFSIELLAGTLDEGGICYEYDGVTDNGDELASLWETLAEKYATLTDSSILAEADAKADGTTVERAMRIYEYCTAKYSLDNFINRDVSGYSFAANVTNPIYGNVTSSSTFIIVVTVVALISVTSIGALVIIKRRKAN